ncbi:low temperature requirement protein A [Oscillatoriales cyanobacterium LEGE 11467]|uniref:Low temperature requirement protein A n=2 Tax=Zarconia TaxID=2992130 RepID=A0A928Z8B0_9CYAN|nr:low temperature requirement protein A [Zarconia navalis LEGE 11467]
MNHPRPPLLRLYIAGENDRDRHATWLELFFDLVFVFAIAELAHQLHSDLSWTGIAGFAALFVPVWWLWIDFSYYADQFDVNNGPYRLVMLGVMFGLVVMALTVPDALDGGAAEFATMYATLRLVIIFLYVQAWRFVPQSRELTARYVLSFSVAFFLWLISIAMPEPTCFWLWAVALLIEISNGPITYLTIRCVPTQNSHMDERFGLFVIIVLGEAIIAVATGVAETDWQLGSILTGIGGFVVAVSLWWMYFERADESVINQALRGGKMDLLRSYIYGYSHIFAFMGIVATGVGIQFAIEAAAGHSFGTEARTVLCGGAAIFLMGVTTLQWASPNPLPGKVIAARLTTAALTVLLIPVGVWLSPLAIVGWISIAFVALNRFDGIPLPAGQV